MWLSFLSRPLLLTALPVQPKDCVMRLRGTTSSSICSSMLRSRARHLSSGAPGLYELLGVLPSATPDELKAAYRRKALEHHPDRHASDEREKAEQAFKAISEAYAKLTDPGKRTDPLESLTKEEAERLFWDIFGADGDVADGDVPHKLVWRVPGRSNVPRKLKNWQHYQAAIEAGDDNERFTSGLEAKALYRACLRALRGVDDVAVAAGVREHARSLIHMSANEADVKRIRAFLIDGRHSLEEMTKCLSTSVVKRFE